METSTIFVLVTDKSYFYKTKVTINDLRTAGNWTKEIALITIDFNLDELDENYKKQNKHTFYLFYSNFPKYTSFPFFARNSICLIVHPNEQPL